MRTDFVGLPTHWTVRSCTSWVADNIDVALHHEDHRAALVHITMDVVSTLRHQRTAESIGPEVDVHTHALQLQQQVAACLPRQQAMGPVQRKTSMSAETWELLLQKRQWRQAMWEANALQRETQLHAVFSQWRQIALDLPEYDLTVSACAFHRLLSEQDRVIARTLFEFHNFGRRVTQAARQDEFRGFQDLMNEGAAFLDPAASRQLWKTIKKALPKYQQRRQGVDPLRLLRLEDDWNPH